MGYTVPIGTGYIRSSVAHSVLLLLPPANRAVRSSATNPSATVGISEDSIRPRISVRWRHFRLSH